VTALAVVLAVALAFRRPIHEALCRYWHAGVHLKPSHVGHGALRCTRCGAGFAGPFDAVGMDDAPVSDATLAKYLLAEERPIEESTTKARPVKPLAPVAQFQQRTGRR